ncbi:NPCBM/NEW2 domain-containing protein, partial [Cetobacterium sp.]
RYAFKIVGKNKNVDSFEKRDNNLAVDSKNYFEARRSIEQVADNVVYLSDLGVKNSNKMTAKDKTIAENPLTLRLENGEVIKFDKGINGVSDNDIIVNIEGKGFKKFQSYVGLDREVLGYRGTAEFKVFADGKEVFNSGVMKSSDRAKFIDVDLNGVKELKLQILNSDGVTKYDHGTYGDAKFIK